MESSWQIGGFESSEEDKAKNEKSDSAPSVRRFEPPRILNMARVHEGQIDLRPTRPAPVFEGMIGAKKESEPTPSPEFEQGSLTAGEFPKIAETAPFIGMTAEQFQAPIGERAEDDETDEDDADDEEGAGATVHPRITPQHTASPSVEQAPAAQHPAEFDEVMHQLGSEYAEAASGTPLEAPVTGEIPSAFTAGEHEAPLLNHDTEWPTTTTRPAPASGGRPPGPPAGPPPEVGGNTFDGRPEPEPEAHYSFNAPSSSGFNGGNVAPSVSTAAEQQAAANETKNAERRGLRRGLVAGFITGYVLKAYLANRKLKRFQEATKQQFTKTTEQLTNLQSQHTELQQQTTSQAEQHQRQLKEQQERLDRFKAGQVALPPRFEAPPAAVAAPMPAIEAQQKPLPQVEAMPAQQMAEQEQWVDEKGNEITLQPGQRLERRGWYSVVVDEHGREVPGAIQYGEAFQREQRREQVSDDAFAASNNGANNGAAAGGAFTALPGIGISSVPAPTMPMVTSGQIDAQHSLPAGYSPVDPQHRLPEPKHPAVAALTSPWLWVGVAILLIAYFIAALV
jgi:TolA-binding protein